MKRIRRLIKWCKEWLRLYRGGVTDYQFKVSGLLAHESKHVKSIAVKQQRKLTNRYRMDISLCKYNIYQESEDCINDVHTIILTYKRKKHETNKYT